MTTFTQPTAVTRFIASGLISLCLSCAPAWTAETAKSEPDMPPKTKMALKLAGLVTFVASSCPELQTDYARFKSSVEALGVSYTDLDKQELKNTYLYYTLRYKQDTAGNCARALKDFGPGGSVIPNLVTAKSK